MLRKGILALMLAAASVGSLHAQEADKSNRLMKLFRGSSTAQTQQKENNQVGVQHANVADAEKQVPEVRQTSQEGVARLEPAQAAPQPTPAFFVPAGYPQGAHVLPAPQAPVHFVAAQQAAVIPGAYQPGPPRQGASMYPAPRPGIPAHVGGTAIHNAAFHPHEMMHAHRYRALYGPYYHKVRGCWVLSPFGIWSKENWKLTGTMVDVQYKSRISPFAMFRRPSVH